MASALGMRSAVRRLLSATHLINANGSTSSSNSSVVVHTASASLRTPRSRPTVKINGQHGVMEATAGYKQRSRRCAIRVC